MKQVRVMFALSDDFGEYVTANIFSRGQPFYMLYALPPRLMRYVPAGQENMVPYDGVNDLLAIARQAKVDVVVLASGYLYPVNRIATPDELRELTLQLTKAGHVLATTDPWLRIWALRPNSHFEVYSMRTQGVAPELSQKMQALQDFLEHVFQGVPHLFAAPIVARGPNWMSFYNPQFASQAPLPAPRDRDVDEWLFVISKEDYIFLSGLERERFFSGLEARIKELLLRPCNRLRFIGPPALGAFLLDRWPSEPRVEYAAFCDFHTFESALRRAKVVAYWNVISSTLLYCLYYRIPVVFFGKGHQARICRGLFEHAVEHLYQGVAPHLLDLDAPLITDADALIERLGIIDWLDRIGSEFARLPPPEQVVAELMRQNAN
jgi:hypothetical protein